MAGIQLNSLKKLSGSRLFLRKNWWLRLCLGLVLTLIVFSVGIEVGNGNLQLNFLSSVKSENQNLPSQLNYSTVTQVYNSLKQNYNGKLTTTQILNGLKEGLAEATGDPYTEYFSPSEAKDFSNELNNSFSGIGVELGKDSNGNLIVISPISGFPAQKAGLKPQDIITSINGQNTSNMSIDVAANDIRGPQNAKVTLGILRDQSQALTVTMTRQNIQLPSVSSKILSGNIGYMQISSFSDDTANLAAKAAEQFKQANAKGIILDLRGNPGGLLSAAVAVSSLWLPTSDTVVQEKGTIGDVTYNATGGDVLNGVPTLGLIKD